MAAVDCSKTPRSKSIKARALTLRGYEARKLAQDGRVLIEATVTGTHDGHLELPHGVRLEPTGRKISLRFLLLMRFDDGLPAHERLFFDHHELIHQLTRAE